MPSDLSRKLDCFLSSHKGQWFSSGELAEKFNVSKTEIQDAFIDLKWNILNFLLRRFEYKAAYPQPFICRKKW